ncbi:MAG TPA: MBOAT family O-acyltransferase [Treponemataceae bacterium]|nr:MBOAT family O-acyltransferase [Treponemataceae bacterium]
MLFPTFSFAVFFFAVFVGFWYVLRRNIERRIFLVAASYFFYALWDWRFCGLLLLSTAANYGFALLIGGSKEHAWRKAYLVLSVVFNLLLLGFFKYYNFFAESANGLIALFSGPKSAMTGAGTGFLFPALNVILPVGVSFYTFKAMSYIFDVYLCKMQPVRSFLDVMLYVSFFPQIASGPIVHAVDFFPQIHPACDAGHEPGSRPIEFDRATVLFLSGLVKKMVFANFLSTLLVDPVFQDPSSFNTLEILLAAIGYSVVIYCDFSGYSDMAISVALLLGFNTPANFYRPYASFSVTEFWKRWHITFSSWLRNYLYFSMGGSRFGLVHTLIALVLTMMLGGLWHGASVVFIVWGAMQGIALALERGLGYGNARATTIPRAAAQIAGTFLFTTVSWIVFRSPSLSSIGTFFAALGNVSTPIRLVSPLVLILVVSGLLMHAVPDSFRQKAVLAYRYVPLAVKGVAVALFFATLAAVSMSGIAPFIYFQF